MTTDPLVVFKTRADARVAKSELPPDHAARRKPLGLAPVGGSSEPAADEPAFVSGVPSAAAGLSAETLARAATMADVAQALDAAVAINLDGDGALRARIGELRGEIARLEVENAQMKGAFAELRAKVNELSFVQERLQVERRGPPGHAGPRGADGQLGPRGECGSRGERGAPAPAVIEWRPDPEAFTVQAILSDGSTGPMIALRSLFEAYHNAVSYLEDADLTEAARQSREETEREAERARWAMR